MVATIELECVCVCVLKWGIGGLHFRERRAHEKGVNERGSHEVHKTVEFM